MKFILMKMSALKTILFPAIAGLIISVVFSLATGNGYKHYRFFARDYLKQQETEDIKKTILFFSGSVAGFYITNGSVAGLNLFPAANLIKRRIFHDIRNWEVHGKIFAMDRDKSMFREISFISPDRAIAVVDENWFTVFQDLKTRKQIPPKNANLITVRYFLQKIGGKWIVLDYEVFDQRPTLPPIPEKKVLPWQ